MELAGRMGPRQPLWPLGHPRLGYLPPPWEQLCSWGGVTGGRRTWRWIPVPTAR